jgi:probable HAF family extracellular repeat protein/autotransporter-associated beta strand protein
MGRATHIPRNRILRAIALAAPFLPAPAIAATYSITDLGSFGGNTTNAAGINSSGEIAGNSQDSTGTSYAFTWLNGTMTNLGTLNGRAPFARTINTFGQVAGNFSNADIFTYSSNGQLSDIGIPLGGTTCRANGINDLGQITGQLTLPGQVVRGFLYNPATGTTNNIGTMSGKSTDFSYGSSVNDSSQIEGDSINSNGLDHAYIWTNGSFHDLGTLGGADSSGVMVNREGHAVGTAELNDTGLPHSVFHPFLYTGTMTDLGTLGGNYGNCNALNDFDVVVGYTYLSDNTTSAPFIWSKGAMTNLNSLIPSNSGDTLTTATGINNSGEIVADGYNSKGQHAAFLLTPTASFLTWDAIGPSGDGVTWDTTSQNWNNGSPAIFANQLNTMFNDANAGPASYHVTLNTTVSPGSVTVNNSEGNYTIGGTGSIAGPTAVFKSGGGSLTLNTSNSYTGGTFVSGGTAIAGASGALPLGPVVLSGGGSLQLAPNTGLTQLTTLAISGSGTFDINNNHVIISYGTGIDPISSIAALIANGYAAGAWNGAGGIISTAAQSNHQYGLGFADSADPGNPAGLVSGTLEVAYALLGDADMNGVVNGIDFGILAANFNKSASSWDQGDFNYDHFVNGIDFSLLAANFNHGASGASADEAIAAFAAANGLLADLPDPSCAALAPVIALGTIRRRKGARIRTHSTVASIPFS